MFVDASKIMEEAIRAQLPFAAYKYPGEKQLTLVLQKNRQLNTLTDINGSGFVFAPYNPLEPPVLLLPDSVHRFECAMEAGTGGSSFPSLQEAPEERQRYLELVRKAQKSMLQGSMQKVVLSRKLLIQRPCNPILAYGAILRGYPGAFCYLWYHPRVGMWLGASPELLLDLEGDNFHTVSLAGTQVYSGEKLVQWGAKECEEQELVTRFIKTALSDTVASLQIGEAQTVRAGNLLHLQSNIRGKMGTATLGQLLARLHPTPAVCGLPRAESLLFLGENEGYNRSYYTGYLGALNMETGGTQARFFVNLRCMSLKRSTTSIYVGGGITPSSVPEKEWQETRDKAGTMLRALFYSAE